MRYKNFTQGFPLLASFLLLATVSNAQYREGDSRQYDNYGNERNSDKYGRNNNNQNGKYGNADNAVRYKPEAPWMRPSPPPSKGHEWMPNEWRWSHGRYVCVPGYWVKPPKKNMRYIPGFWNRTREGWVWRQGHWAKGNSNNKW